MSDPAKSFEDLIVWQKAHQFVLSIYGISADFPKAEIYGLTAQIRRAAVSIPSNIAEGFHRRGQGDKLKFFNYSQASLEEVRYQLILARDLNYADTNSLLDQADEVGRLLTSYSSAIRNSSS
ncbi:MAG: four helix bundle protein [Verrucomicrobiales bacterium]|nr:four helix bundle protein [Verrucomicrobiales bacterium]